MIRAWFVSDVHLKTMQERNSDSLLRFLHSMTRDVLHRPSHLFLVGDIFDLWIGRHEFFVRKFAPIIEAVRGLIRAGVEVHFFEGNHDLYLKDYWENELGVRVHSEAAYFELAGLIVRVEHGDLINPDDRGYLFLRALLRSGSMTWLARSLPSVVVAAIGERASHASREYTSSAKGLPKESIVSLIRQHAETAFMRKPFDLMITGHVHVVDDHQFDAGGRRVRSVNLGSWYDGPKAFLLTESAPESRLIELESSL